MGHIPIWAYIVCVWEVYINADVIVLLTMKWLDETDSGAQGSVVFNTIRVNGFMVYMRSISAMISAIHKLNWQSLEQLVYPSGLPSRTKQARPCLASEIRPIEGGMAASHRHCHIQEGGSDCSWLFFSPQVSVISPFSKVTTQYITLKYTVETAYMDQNWDRIIPTNVV